jgi:hypothetical protein
LDILSISEKAYSLIPGEYGAIAAGLIAFINLLLSSYEDIFSSFLVIALVTISNPFDQIMVTFSLIFHETDKHCCLYCLAKERR